MLELVVLLGIGGNEQFLSWKVSSWGGDDWKRTCAGADGDGLSALGDRAVSHLCGRHWGETDFSLASGYVSEFVDFSLKECDIEPILT